MKFSELKKIHILYQDYEKENIRLFEEFKSKSIWGSLNFDEDNIDKDVLGFLNKWGNCRIPRERKRKILESLKKVKENIQYFKEKTLWEDFDLNNEELQNQIKTIFEELEKINRISGVAISKMLHMFNPEFFIMWDNKIMAYYGFFNNFKGYLNFFHKMKLEIIENDIIKFYKKIDLEGVTLLKLIDEFNFKSTR